MVITYEAGNTLYINITNRCSNHCIFCVRDKQDGVGSADSLWLEYEPSNEEILQDIFNNDLSSYEEICFCGFGEPCSRLFDLIYIARKIKEKIDIPIRINTNGQANYVYKADITPLFYGAIDELSISLNGKDAKQYEEYCQPDGDAQEVYASILDFTKKAAKYVPNVKMTVLDILPKEDIEACRKICEDMGVKFRVRKYIA
jgi:TatD family-associated radical SAM protein